MKIGVKNPGAAYPDDKCQRAFMKEARCAQDKEKGDI